MVERLRVAFPREQRLLLPSQRGDGCRGDGGFELEALQPRPEVVELLLVAVSHRLLLVRVALAPAAHPGFELFLELFAGLRASLQLSDDVTHERLVLGPALVLRGERGAHANLDRAADRGPSRLLHWHGLGRGLLHRGVAG